MFPRKLIESKWRQRAHKIIGDVLLGGRTKSCDGNGGRGEVKGSSFVLLISLKGERSQLMFGC